MSNLLTRNEKPRTAVLIVAFYIAKRRYMGVRMMELTRELGCSREFITRHSISLIEYCKLTYPQSDWDSITESKVILDTFSDNKAHWDNMFTKLEMGHTFLQPLDHLKE